MQNFSPHLTVTFQDSVTWCNSTTIKPSLAVVYFKYKYFGLGMVPNRYNRYAGYLVISFRKSLRLY